MPFLPEGTTNFHYTPDTPSALSRVDIRAGFEFGHPEDPAGFGLANLRIAECIIRDQEADITSGRPVRPIAASRTIVNALDYLDRPTDDILVFSGPSAKGVRENTGTFGELQQLKASMDENGYSRAALYTVAQNIGNAARQAFIVGLDFAVPPDLPKAFNSSGQLWTRNRFLWAASSPLRIALLRSKGH